MSHGRESGEKGACELGGNQRVPLSCDTGPTWAQVLQAPALISVQLGWVSGCPPPVPPEALLKCPLRLHLLDARTLFLKMLFTPMRESCDLIFQGVSWEGEFA